jgi:DnaJ-domain-containing protein 1
MLNRADIREARLKLEYARIEKYYKSDSTLNESKKTESINTAKENFVKNTSVTTFGRSQFSMCLSTGMVVALLTFLRTYRKE